MRYFTFATSALVAGCLCAGTANAGPPKWLDATIDQILADNTDATTPGLAAAVVVNGQIYYNQSGKRRFGSASNVQAADRFQMGSISKPITGEWLARYIDAGYMTWNTTLDDVMPELFAGDPANPFRFVTAAEFMSHTSGMPYSPVVASPPWDYTNIPDLRDRRYEYVKDALEDAALYSPGTVAVYDGGAVIATSMLERITGMQYENLVNALFIPASMTNTNFNPLSSPYPNITGVFSHSWDGINNPGPLAPVDKHVTRSPVGGVNSTIVDMASFLSYAMTSQPDLWKTVGRSKWTRLGWAMHMKDNAGGVELWHNGSDGTNYADARVWPRRGVAIVVAANYNARAKVNAISNDIIASLGTWGAPAPTFPYATAPTYQLPLAQVSASNVYQGMTASYGPLKAFDGSFSSRWATDDDVTSAWIQGTLSSPKSVKGFVISEAGPYAVSAQPEPTFTGDMTVSAYRVTKFNVYLWDSVALKWILAHQGDEIGPRRQIYFRQAYPNITQGFLSMISTGGATIQEFHLQ
jgi:CubicO group peptidase (beta-lactamase class C family)